jgi:hypothetical protein
MQGEKLIADDFKTTNIDLVGLSDSTLNTLKNVDEGQL